MTDAQRWARLAAAAAALGVAWAEFTLALRAHRVSGAESVELVVRLRGYAALIANPHYVGDTRPMIQRQPEAVLLRQAADRIDVLEARAGAVSEKA